MRKLLILLFILFSLNSIGQITTASYTNKGARVPYIDASTYKVNGVTGYLSQWTTSSSNIYFLNAVGIGTNTIGSYTKVNLTDNVTSSTEDVDYFGLKLSANVGHASAGHKPTNYYGIYIYPAHTGIGSRPTNNIGVYSNVTGADNNYPAIFMGGGVGIGTTAPTKDLGFGGNTAKTLGLERHTTSNTAGVNLSINAGGAAVSSTDKNGGILYLIPGISTGRGFSSIRLQSMTRGNSSGSTINTPTDRIIIPSRKYLDDNVAVDLIDVTLGSATTTGGKISYTIHAMTGSEYQAHTGTIIWAAVSKGTVITAAVSHASAASGMELDVVSSGTITDTWSVFEEDLGKITIRINANSSLTIPTIWIEFVVENFGSTAITQL